MSDFQSQASKFGREYEDHVAEWLESEGFTITARRHRHESGVEFSEFGVGCKGSPRGATRAGMKRSDNRWKVFEYLYRLRVWRDRTGQLLRYVLVTSDVPDPASEIACCIDLAELVGDLQVIEVPAPQQ